ncbi:MAG: CPBP family intramembrane glutamic endopeptidase [Phenylobacterium sp.]|uniref:CPBP family intramembrane glutamic endopeptidase n=1 Tax=Phenylobacterium sp. TaxID=1871053 RepID=UPI003919A082
MSSTLTSPASAPPRPRATACSELAGLLALGALLIWLPMTAAVGGGLLERLITPGRILALCLIASYLLYRRGENWRSLGLSPPTSWLRTAGLVVGGYLAVGLLATVLIGLVFPRLGLRADAAASFGALRGDPWEYAYWIAIAWTSAAIGEELLFRGFVQSRLQRIVGHGRLATGVAVIGQAALFGLGHAYQGLGGVLLTGVTGLVLGIVYVAGRRNLAPCILLHGLIDTVSLTALFLGVAPGA